MQVRYHPRLQACLDISIEAMGVTLQDRGLSELLCAERSQLAQQIPRSCLQLGQLRLQMHSACVTDSSMPSRQPRNNTRHFALPAIVCIHGRMTGSLLLGGGGGGQR